MARILIVEDSLANITAAEEQLGLEHDLVIVSGFDQALEALQSITEICNPKDMLLLVKQVLEGTPYNAGLTIENTLWFTKNADQDKFLSNLPEELGTRVEAIVEMYQKEGMYDVVLTDVMFPKGGDRCMSPEGRELARRQGEMPYGPVVALQALQMGIKKVGIITAGNHHADPFVFAFDYLRGFTLGDVKVVATNYGLTKAGVKDWKSLLEELMK